MGEIRLSKPDFLIEQTYQHDRPEFILEAFERRDPDPGDIALKEAFSQIRERLLQKIATMPSRQGLLNDFILARFRRKLSPSSVPHPRAALDKYWPWLDDKETKQRFIFSEWPQPLPENSFSGKMTPNENMLWGATLFDFFSVQRTYEQLGRLSISTSSRLEKWAKAAGEIEGKIKVYLERAEAQKDPEVIEPYDIQVVIQEWEELMRQQIIASQMDEEYKDQGEGELRLDRWTLPEQWPPKSVFEPEAYPRGWTTEAFSDDKLFGPSRAAPVLRHYIPQHRLPKRLVVHDPSDLLKCRSRSGYPAGAGPNIIYKLKHSGTYASRRKADEEEEAKEEAHAKNVLESFLANPHSSLQRPDGLELVDLKEPGWTKPPVFVVFPYRPSLSRPKEAHLYLSPNYLMGEGSHSCVYGAEMVVPRSWLVHAVMCIECVKDDVKEVLEKEDGPHGERRLKKWDEKTGMVVRQEIRKRPIYTTKKWDIGTSTYVIQDAVNMDVMVYEGPYRVVHTRIEYQNLERGPLCVHLSKGKAHLHPLATKVRLAAKLSRENRSDLEMLQTEAYNYQRFPKHFFEHWSGYNVWRPMTEPVPVRALVPQFYGFYCPEDKTGPYKSPILLIEQCGKQIVANKLTVDDRNECLSLGFRMNAAGWLHGSIWERNILKQPGPLNESRVRRNMNMRRRNGCGADWSFRLIDFGRSRHFEDLIDAESYRRLPDETKKLICWWQSKSGYWDWD